MGVLWSHYSLGRIALAADDSGAATEHAEAALQIARQVHSSAWISKVSDLIQQIEAAPDQAPKTANQGLLEPLSQRELEILQLLKTELGGPEIADRLMVSLNTVRYHTKNIYQKLQVNSRRAALIRAKELGL
jgi:LuxR family maltose regulon positive regulatory protein